MRVMQIIGMRIAGHHIVEAVWTGEDRGYCMAHNGRQYVTWGFIVRGADVDAYHGHYFIVDWDAPARSETKARADLYARAAEALAMRAEYGF